MARGELTRGSLQIFTKKIKKIKKFHYLTRVLTDTVFTST